ncbi:MAG: tetratricopeptide repeat protein [Blastochloris sp.]|nr:tetratricopeptide repeat protein [Blastochloris sp.]
MTNIHAQQFTGDVIADHAQKTVHQYIDTYIASTTREWKRPQQGPYYLTEGAVKRRTQLDALHELLEAGGPVVVVGAPYAGKSTLAAFYVKEFGTPERYPGGVLWVHMQADIPQSTLDVWASLAYGGDLQTIRQLRHNDAAMRPEQVQALIDGHGRLLVVFDDVRGGPQMIAPLREALPADTHILATTREQAVAITFPARVQLEDLTPEEAVTLLDMPELPQDLLAELAAKMRYRAYTIRSTSVSIKSISTRPEDRITLVKELLSRPITPPTELTETSDIKADLVDFALHFAYDEIGRTQGFIQQQRIRTLAILDIGGTSFSNALAARIWNLSLEQTNEVLEMLRDRLFLERVDDHRWAFHERMSNLLRELQQKATAAEVADAQARYRAYFNDLATTIFTGPSQQWPQFDSDLPYLLDVWRRIRAQIEALSVENEELQRADLDFLATAAPFIVSHSELGSQIETWLRDGLFLASHLGQRPQAALLHFVLGRYFIDINDEEAAVSELEQAVEIWQSEDLEGVVWSLNLLGIAHTRADNFAQAAAIYEQALTLPAAEETETRLALLTNLGFLKLHAQLPAEALAPLHEALTLAEKTGYVYNQVMIQQALGAAYRDTDQPGNGESLIAMADALIAELHDPALRSNLLLQKGNHSQ